MSKLQEILSAKNVTSVSESSQETIFVVSPPYSGFFIGGDRFVADAFGEFHPTTEAQRTELEYQYSQGRVNKKHEIEALFEKERNEFLATEPQENEQVS